MATTISAIRFALISRTQAPDWTGPQQLLSQEPEV